MRNCSHPTEGCSLKTNAGPIMQPSGLGPVSFAQSNLLYEKSSDVNKICIANNSLFYRSQARRASSILEIIPDVFQTLQRDN